MARRAKLLTGALCWHGDRYAETCPHVPAHQGVEEVQGQRAGDGGGADKRTGGGYQARCVYICFFCPRFAYSSGISRRLCVPWAEVGWSFDFKVSQGTKNLPLRVSAWHMAMIDVYSLLDCDWQHMRRAEAGELRSWVVLLAWVGPLAWVEVGEDRG